jgi:phosphoenolpyruvate synthase/pyruvate phosphate dikinase
MLTLYSRYRYTRALTFENFFSAEGVGELIKICIERARASNPNVVFGVSGEHGGDPASIHLFESMGIHYVSCSPFRVPIARLSGASPQKSLYSAFIW